MWLWPLAVMAAACVPVVGAFSTTHVFHVRDLGLFFWPRHLWLRESLLEGRWPLWDPYAAAGQSAVADALNQLFFPVALALRFLPAVVGFNLWIALPFPVAALGTYVLLAERVSRPAAALGALVFVASGPVVSSGNFPNFSWAIALLPWVLWSAIRLTARPSPRRFAATAGLVALQALAGEPVTLIATGALVAGWAWHGEEPRPLAVRFRHVALVGGAGLLAVLLAAVQLLPLAAAAAGSMRAGGADFGMWSLHPAAIVEAFSPHFFGDTYEASYDRLPWVQALNSDREPLLFTLYVGIGAILLAMFGWWARSGSHARWAAYWLSASSILLVLALGTYTPIYPFVVGVVPALESLRFPIKYGVVAMLGLAALAGLGWDRLVGDRMRDGGSAPSGVTPVVVVAMAVGACALSVGIATAALPLVTTSAVAALASWIGIEEVDVASAYIVASMPPAATRLILLSAGVGALVWFAAAARREARLAAGVLFAVAVLDPLSVNARMHPTLPVSELGPPSWTRFVPAGERVYIGGKLAIAGSDERIDGIQRAAVDIELSKTMIEAQTRASTQYAMTPAAWKLREVISYDLPQLWPQHYHRMLRHFASSEPEARLRYLSRAGVRFCFVAAPPHPSAVELAYADWLPGMALYDCGPPRPRAFVAGGSRLEPDLERQMRALFDPEHDARVVLVQAPPAADRPDRMEALRVSAVGPIVASEIVEDDPERMVVRAVAGPDGGYLTVLDTYDAGWRAWIGGVPVPILRADVLFRAVQIPPGEHLVEFRYVPTPLYVGAGLTLLGLGILGLVLYPVRAGSRTVSAGTCGREALMVSPPGELVSRSQTLTQG